MILWKQQFKAMLRICKNSFFAIIVLGLLCTGCSEKKIDSITLGEWIALLDEKAGITLDSSDEPYFVNVQSDSPYFPYVQAAVEYGVFDESIEFPVDDELNRAWLAYSLVNLSNMTSTYDTEIHDCENHEFLHEISESISLGLLDLDKNGNFNPDEIVDRNEAENLLMQVVASINDMDTTNIQSIEVDDSKVIYLTPIFFDEDTLEGVFPLSHDIENGKYVSWINQDGYEYMYQVQEYLIDGNTIKVKLKDGNVLDYSKSIQLEGEADLDLSKAEIIEEDEDETSSFSSPYISNVSIHALKKSKTINGYTVSYQVTSSGIQAEIKKTLDHGESIFATCKLNGLKIKYKWYSDESDINNAYFKIDAHTEESLGVKGTEYKQLYGDFSQLDSKDFLSSVQGFLKEKKDIPEIEIPICTIRIPVESSNTLTVKAKLSVKIYATGQAKLTLTQEHVLGMDIRNGHPRIIREFEHDENASLRAETGITSSTKFSLDFLKQSLMDIQINGGAKALINTTVHLYDEEGDVTSVKSDLPTDALESLASGNPNILVCADMKAYWLLSLKLNSSSSLLGKLGFGETIQVLNEKNAPLFPNANQHMENWKFVEKCTRSKRTKSITKQTMQVTEHIVLNSYSMIVHLGETKKIQITGLPKGYQLSDLEFTSNDSSIVSVTSDGTLVSHASGSTQIVIQTADHQNQITCSILVPEK